jgi:hypothetical protein
VVRVLPLITQSTSASGWTTSVADVIARRKALLCQLPKEHPDLERDADLPQHGIVPPRGSPAKLLVHGVDRELSGCFQGPGDDVRV